jgi:uncharacterized caspase-like protein
MNNRQWIFVFVVLSLVFALAPASAQTNVALVIGNSAYQNAKPLSTAIADASAVAETMRGAGYDVIVSTDIRQRDIGEVMRTFLDKVAAAGGNAVAFFYYTGYAAQFRGVNYLVPIDAPIGSASDIPAQSLRLGEFVEALTKTPAAARIIVLDASYSHGFDHGATDVPPGLAVMVPPPGMAIASAAAPRQIAAAGSGTHSLYTQTLLTLMRQRGLELDQIFKAARFQVHQATAGKQTPWMTSALMVDLTLFPNPNAAPQAAASGTPQSATEPSKKKEQRRHVERRRSERAASTPAEPRQSPALPAIIGITPGGISIGIGQ